MFCQQCGTKIEEGVAFCTNCGAKQVVSDKPENNNTVNNEQAQPVMNAQPNPQFNQPMNQQGYAQPNMQYNQPANQQGYAQPNMQYNQPVNQQGYAQPNAYAYPNPNPSGSPKKVSFGEAIKLYFTNYANFTGRSTVSEYWYAYLFNFLVSLCTSWIPVLGGLISLALLIPGLSIAVRRLHDTGKSWVYLFMGLIPLAGWIILLVQFCKASDGDNKWGPAARN